MKRRGRGLRTTARRADRGLHRILRVALARLAISAVFRMLADPGWDRAAGACC